MAKNILFSFNPQGQIVYRKTGRLAPASYHVGEGSRSNTVYGPDGRKAGTISRTIPDAKTKRQRQKAAAKAKAKRSSKPKAPKTPRAKEEAKRKAKITAASAEDDLVRRLEKAEFASTEDPEKSDAVIEEFARKVRQVLTSNLPDSLASLVGGLRDAQIWTAYLAHEFEFEVFFIYGGGKDEEGGERTARWILGLIQRIGRE